MGFANQSKTKPEHIQKCLQTFSFLLPYSSEIFSGNWCTENKETLHFLPLLDTFVLLCYNIVLNLKYKD